MEKLRLINLVKRYDQTVVVHDLNLTIRTGEFLTLLGPSGCGKTTTLRMIAGFIRPTAGQILLNGHEISSERTFLPPEQRSMGMVFQSYAVWPHMRVFDNVAYPLKLRRLSRQAIRTKVEEVLALVKLDAYATRYPNELSGGQQQRVALARTLAMEPEVLLLDEPLSNLDAKLRETMRYEIVELQKRLNMTVVYVTHDQLEALSMSDRVMVMNEGVVQQIDTPQAVYDTPANRFVAGFIGLSNFIPCQLDTVTGTTARVTVTTGNQIYPVQAEMPTPVTSSQPTLFVRPNDLQIVDSNDGIPAVLVGQTFLGDRFEYLVRLGDVTLRLHQDTAYPLSNGEHITVRLRRALVLN